MSFFASRIKGAASGKPEALELFRKVILASASVPGLFDPVCIQKQGLQFNLAYIPNGFNVKSLVDRSELYESTI